jgi:tripartite ATP-independent transporter DctP family solute receptor
MKKLRGLSFVVMMLFCLFIISGCSSNADAKSTKVITIATVHPEQHPIYKGLIDFQDYIHENLGDRFEVNIFSNGVIGNNSEVLELLQMGSLDLAVVSGSNMEAYAEEYKIFAIPYLFNDEQSFREIMNNEEFTTPIYESTADKGIKGVTWFANGVNNFYSKDKIEVPEDLEGQKIRVQPSDINVRMVQGFGGAAVMLAYGEIYTGIQNGVIDVATNPEMALADMRHGEVADYYSRTEHQIFTDVFVTNTDFIESLSEKERTVFEDAFQLSTEVANEAWDKRIAEAIEESEEMGIEFVEVDKELFKEKQKPVRESVLEAIPELQPLFDKVQELQN